MLKRAMLWLRSNVMRARYEREMRDEMTEHIERAARLLMARGLSEPDARMQARREFGEVTYHQTEARDARGTLWLDDLAGDARFALRHFARKPGTTVMMLVVLAAGMSISTLLFSWVHGLMFTPPPAVALQSDLVRIRGVESDPDGVDARRFQEAEFRAYRELTSHFTAVAGWIDDTGVLQVPDDAERRGYDADLVFVTENYFSTTGVRPVIGAGLPAAASENAADNAVAVIDHQAWKNLFGQRGDVIGSTITINGVTLTVVGVAPEMFTGLRNLTGIQVWVPLAARHLLITGESLEYGAVARLRPGVSPEAASAAVQTIAARFDTTAGRSDVPKPSTQIVPLLVANMSPEFEEDFGMIALAVGALGSLVLLITCTNVSALLTGLAAARRQEIAVRLSLGAARARIIRQLLTESAVLAVVAGTVALGVVALIFKALVVLVPDLPVELKIRLPTMAFTFGIALAVGVLFGLSPALHATRLALASVLRDSSGGIASSRARLQRTLVVAQIAFTQPLIVLMATMLVFVGTFAQPMMSSESSDRIIRLGVQTASSVAFDATPESERRQRELILRLRDQVRALPGVQEALVHWPDQWLVGQYTVHPGDEVGGRKPVQVGVMVQSVEPQHFETMDIPVVAGRTFQAADIPGGAAQPEASAIIGKDLAEALWGSANPVGRRMRMADQSETGPGTTLRVVGVVDDPAARTRVADEAYRVYSAADLSQGAYSWLMIRTAAPAEPLLPAIRDVAQKTASTAIVTAETLAGIEEQHNRKSRRLSGAISAAGIAALLLSAIGLYAVIAFSVSQRTQEIAVRLAVGARGNQIANQFVGDGLRLGAIGLLIGLPVGILAVRQAMIQVNMRQLPVLPIILVATLGIMIVAAIAAWAPARRAAIVDPATTLRNG